MEQQTEGCIALLPLDNGQGLVEILNTATIRDVVRDQCVELPTPDVIALSKLAEKQERSLRRDPIFILNTNQIDDDNTNDDNSLINREPKMMKTQI